ncbi:hypothetical protein [Nocardia beijingensis]|uniref:hypothetical protein n=1 Tax=Nocardia beijingensis TaxID=95162 RepID=UPI0037BCFB55
MPEQNDDRKPFRRGAPDSGSGRRGDNQDADRRGGGFNRRADSGERGGYNRRGESGGYGAREGSSDRGNFQRRDNSGGFDRRGDSGGADKRGGQRGGFGRRDSGDRTGDTGGFRRGGDAPRRGGFERRDEPAGRGGPGERGGFRRNDDSGDRGGFKRRGDSEERRDESRSGFRSGGDSGARGGFRRGDSPRGESPRGGFDRRRDDSGDRGEARRGEAGERAGFKRRGDFDDRGDAGRRGESGFQRRDDDRRRQGSDRDGRRDDDREGSTSRGEDRRRGGEGARVGAGRSLDRRPPRPEEPDLPDEVQAADLDSAVRRDLLSLDKGNAETVARHLVMAVRLLDDDPGLALAHARAARQRAGRIAVVRETAGVVAYHAGEWAEALSELRTARRMSGGSGLLAVMADCERGLGRPERAIELGRSDEARALRGDEAAELRIVVAGARMDLGQYDQAVVTLQTSDLDPSRTGSAAARLFYAYADALVAAGRTDEGLTWFLNAASADLDGETDAEERAAELTGDSDI